MKLHREIAALFGYELIKKRKLNDTLEQHLSNLLSLLDINVVIDVGANTGQYGNLLRRSGFRGRIISFEPLASAYAELATVTRDDANWQVHNLALGREVTVKTLNRLGSPDFSSFLEPNSFGLERFEWRVEIAERQEVQVASLSSVWADVTQGIRQVKAFLKLDTQGFDLEVFAGAIDVLHEVLGIQAEVATKPIYKDTPDYLAALTEFDRAGFEITGLYPITRCKDSLAVIEYDCVMRRKSAPQQG